MCVGVGAVSAFVSFACICPPLRHRHRSPFALSTKLACFVACAHSSLVGSTTRTAGRTGATDIIVVVVTAAADAAEMGVTAAAAAVEGGDDDCIVEGAFMVASLAGEKPRKRSSVRAGLAAGPRPPTATGPLFSFSLRSAWPSFHLLAASSAHTKAGSKYAIVLPLPVGA